MAVQNNTTWKFNIFLVMLNWWRTWFDTSIAHYVSSILYIYRDYTHFDVHRKSKTNSVHLQYFELCPWPVARPRLELKTYLGQIQMQTLAMRQAKSQFAANATSSSRGTCDWWSAVPTWKLYSVFYKLCEHIYIYVQYISIIIYLFSQADYYTQPTIARHRGTGFLHSLLGKAPVEAKRHFPRGQLEGTHQIASASHGHGKTGAKTMEFCGCVWK